MTIRQEQQQEQREQRAATSALSVVLGAGVAVVSLAVAVVLYDGLFGLSYSTNHFWWARAAEGVLIGGGALLAWHAGRVRLAAAVGLVVTAALLVVGIAFPSAGIWAVGQSPVIWALLVPFAVRALAPARTTRVRSAA